jgi:hypothetical protein
LSAVYALRETYELWQELPLIEGYPAVAFVSVKSHPHDRCTLAVGVNDQLAFQVSGTLPSSKAGKADPCQATQVAATMMVKTMKGEA